MTGTMSIHMISILLTAACFHASYRRTLDDQIWTEDTHCGNSNTGLCGSVCRTEAGEDDGCCAAHRSEEGLYHVSASDLVHVHGRLGNVRLGIHHRRRLEGFEDGFGD